MSDFQALALFVFGIMVLSTYTLNQFLKWQIQDTKNSKSKNAKLDFDPEEKFKQLAQKRINLNDAIRYTSRIITVEEINGHTPEEDDFQYCQYKIDYKE